MIPNLSITIVDLLVALTVLVSAACAYNRGFIYEILTILAWIMSIIIAVHFYADLSPFFYKYITSIILDKLISIIILFIISFVILSLCANIIHTAIYVLPIQTLDKTLGFLLGVLRGWILTSLIFFIFTCIWSTKDIPIILKKSRSMPLLRTGAQIISSMLPNTWNHRLPSSSKLIKLHLTSLSSNKSLH